MTVQVLPGPVIAAGQSLSAALDVSTYNIFRITMSPQWTGARLSFQLSDDGVNFYDVFNRQGLEVVLSVVPASVITLTLGDDNYIKDTQAIKFRSGTRDFPVLQAAERAFGVVVESKPAVMHR